MLLLWFLMFYTRISFKQPFSVKKDSYRDADRNMLTSKGVGNLGMADISIITQVCLSCQLCFR